MPMPEFERDGDDLVLRVTLDSLASATELSPAFQDIVFDEKAGDFRKITVTDKAAWAKAVLTEVHNEAEDGTTLIHRMFDKAFSKALDQGASGITIPGITD
jgi:hypothetical protein